MLGFTITVTSDPAQVPNNPGWGGVGVQNVDPTIVIELCDDPGFPNGYIYNLEPGNWYAFANTQAINPDTGQVVLTGTQSYWARTASGSSALMWINPGGAANIGRFGSAAGTALAVSNASIAALSASIAESLDPPVGEDVQFTLPSDSHIAALTMTLQTDGEGSDRYPYLYIWKGSLAFKVPMAADPISIDTSAEFYGYTNWPSNFLISGAGPVQTFSIPDLLLPEGTLVQTFTRNLQLGDQWSDVGMILKGP
jgi:hypothetical protein